MNISHDPLSDTVTPAAGRQSLAAAALPGSFIVNLRSLAAPLAIPQPQTPELKRFRFFVSRRPDGEGERFFLTMGFFLALPEAESWLNTLRPTYPNAFVSQLPGAPGVSAPAVPVLSETQTLRVLEARAPGRALAASEFEMEDSSRTTGVRHLRIEVQKKSKVRTRKA